MQNTNTPVQKRKRQKGVFGPLRKKKPFGVFTPISEETVAFCISLFAACGGKEFPSSFTFSAPSTTAARCQLRQLLCPFCGSARFPCETKIVLIGGNKARMGFHGQQ